MGVLQRCCLLLQGKVHAVKTQLELRLAGNVRDNKKDFLKHGNREKRSKDNIILLLDEDGHLTNKDAGKAQMYNSSSSTLMVGSGIMTVVTINLQPTLKLC